MKKNMLKRIKKKREWRRRGEKKRIVEGNERLIKKCEIKGKKIGKKRYIRIKKNERDGEMKKRKKMIERIRKEEEIIRKDGGKKRKRKIEKNMKKRKEDFRKWFKINGIS